MPIYDKNQYTGPIDLPWHTGPIFEDVLPEIRLHRETPLLYVLNCNFRVAKMHNGWILPVS